MSDAEGDEPFHMLQTWIDGRKLVEVGRMLSLPLRKTDNNYLAHCLLGKLFGDAAPGPYWLDDDPNREDRREMQLLAYAEEDAEGLKRRAKTFAEPSLYEAVDWNRTATKEMPERFPQEMNLGFEARVCPVIRKSSAGEGRNQKGEKRTWEAGDELDAFLAEAWTSDEDAEIEREKVYRGWFERQLDNRGGARAVAETVGLKRFTIADMTRRTHGDDRKVRTIKRPDATLVGELQVTDSEQFRELLKSGIGRHKSFGYGMLKVRPA